MKIPIIFEAIQLGDREAIEGAPLSALDALHPETGLTALMEAARDDDAETLEVLIGARPTLDVVNARGQSALHLAADLNHPTAARLLVAAGANPLLRDAEGRTPADLAASVGGFRILRELEVSAARRDRHWLARLKSPDAAALEAFEEGAPMRAVYREMYAYRTNRSLKQKAEAKLSAARGNISARRTAEQSAATLDALPHIAAPAPDTSDHGKIRRIAAALCPLEADEFEELLYQHHALMGSGGDTWMGMWDRWEHKDLSFGLFVGPAGETGARLEMLCRDVRQLVLSGLDLRCALLSSMVADGVDFSGSDLSHSLMVNGTYTRADFRDATLVRTDFSQSDLSGADFRGANLTLADFEECDLRGADFRGAVLRGTLFPEADLSGALR